MSIHVQIGDLIEETKQCGGRTLEVLALKQGHWYRNQHHDGWHMQLRNIRGTKKYWVPVTILENPVIIARHYQPLHRRGK